MVEHRTTIHLPPIREVLGRAGRPLLEFTLVPLALFWVLLSEVGFDAGLIAGLWWAGLAIGRRLVVGQKLPTILLITTTLLVVRTVVGLETGSAFLYFLQPTVQNFVFGGMASACASGHPQSSDAHPAAGPGSLSAGVAKVARSRVRCRC